jgi:hypothetical protein
MSDKTTILERLDADLNIIQKLGDEPNIDNSLNATELKAKFDEAANIIQRYINEVLIPYTEHLYSESNPPTAEAVGAARTMLYTATLSTDWTFSNSGYFYQDVAVDGILETDTPIVDFLPGADGEVNIQHSKNMCKILWITTSENSIRVRATEAIGTALPIQLKVVR